MLFVFILPQGTGSALCQHILKLKPLYPCKLPGNRVGKRIRPAFSYL